MDQCPNCSQSINIEESHHGTLYTCPHCQNVFFVGWDGKPEVTDQAIASADQAMIQSTADIGQTMDPQVMPNNNFELNTPFAQPEYQSIQTTPIPTIPDLGIPDLGVSSAALEFDPNKKESFNDVVEFGNAASDSGLITFQLTIQGIDHSQLYKKVADALTDSKFNWQVDEVMSRIQNGVLILEGLTPAATVVLVQRLKYLPVDIQWRQHVLTN